MITPTMRVMPWGQGQGDFVEINVEDFNPDVHTPFDVADKPAGQTGENEPQTLTAAQIKEALTAKGVAFKSNAPKAELQALLDAADKPAE